MAYLGREGKRGRKKSRGRGDERMTRMATRERKRWPSREGEGIKGKREKEKQGERKEEGGERERKAGGGEE